VLAYNRTVAQHWALMTDDRFFGADVKDLLKDLEGGLTEETFRCAERERWVG